jgi:dolichyl-phosphate-mannose-protein mannosyltransferase
MTNSFYGGCKVKRIVMFFVLLVVFFYSMPAMADGTNIVPNSGFEEGSGDMAASWTENVWDKNAGATEIKWDESQKHSGSKSVCIINSSTNDSRLQQEIAVEGNSLYKLSCWIKTENVGMDSKGANLSVGGLLDTTRDIKGANGKWEQVELYGKTSNKQSSFLLTLGLGGYGSTNTGKAWFDDVSVENIDKLPAGVNAIKLYSDSEPSTAAQPTENAVAGEKNSYNGPLVAYGVVYLLMGVIVYFVFRRNIFKIPEGRERIILIAVLGVGLIIRLVSGTKVEGFPVDIGCFKAWASAAANDLPNFYNTGMFCDYPPFYIYILFIIGKIASLSWLGLDYTLLVKLPSIIADVVTAYIAYRLAKKQFNAGIGLVLAGAYIFNPVVLLDSALWGQVDSFFTMLIAVALLLLTERKIKLSSVVFALAFLMKPQAIFFLPVLLFELIKRRSVKDFILAFISALITAIIIIIPFSRDPLWIVKLYSGTASGYTYASLNAFNFFSMIGANLKDDSLTLFFLSYKTWGLIFDVLVFGFAGFLYIKGRHKALPFIIALLLNSGAFIFSSRMHERYMFPVLALALLAFVYLKDKRLTYVFAVLTITNFTNINTILYRMLTFNNPHVPAEDMLMRLTSFINVLVFIYLVKISIDLIINGKTEAYVATVPQVQKQKWRIKSMR